jgi:hypothetical protein
LFREILFYTNVSKVKHIFTTCFGVTGRLFLYIQYVIMSSSFIMSGFMNDIATIVNHNLILYSSMTFLLAYRIVHFLSFLSTGLGICCSVQSVKAKKPGKYFSTSSAGVFSLFVIEHIFCGIGTHCLTNPSIF